ncbi:MAG: hypothetical protein ABI277_15630 [Burkholderiaceae bacterium]
MPERAFARSLPEGASRRLPGDSAERVAAATALVAKRSNCASQDPRGAPDPTPLWNILDPTPHGRGTDWYPTPASGPA